MHCTHALLPSSYSADQQQWLLLLHCSPPLCPPLTCLLLLLLLSNTPTGSSPPHTSLPTTAAVDKMGIFSNMFSSSSSSSSAGKIESNKQSVGPAAASNKPNVWRSVFDPGSNPNIDRVGSAYYDTVHKVGVGLPLHQTLCVCLSIAAHVALTT